jgi:SAM-dependent methyltransferase
LKEGPAIYDDFYVNIYDQLVYNQAKDNYEIGEILNATKPTSESIVLDIGSGTGHHVALLESQGIETTGVDSSDAMVKKARENYPDYKFVKGSVMDPSLFMPDSYTHILCLYFSIYYFQDKTKFFDNTMKWLMPGGFLVVHLVDREMFDPILPPANPLFLVSPQKYAKERITQSKVMFNNMEYVANFDLDGEKNVATFSEKFKEKDGDKVRKNKHTFYMEPHKSIIVMAQESGFILQGKIDLLKVGYEYQYLYIFVKPN